MGKIKLSKFQLQIAGFAAVAAGWFITNQQQKNDLEEAVEKKLAERDAAQVAPSTDA